MDEQRPIENLFSVLIVKELNVIKETMEALEIEVIKLKDASNLNRKDIREMIYNVEDLIDKVNGYMADDEQRRKHGS